MSNESRQYDSFLSTKSKKQWEKISAEKHIGLAIPLFSLYSSGSIGIGEIPDLKFLIDWCSQVGMDIIQFLPLNDVGFKFTPYDAQSTFALEPMYLSIKDLLDIDIDAFREDIEVLKEGFPTRKDRVDYRIKGAKLGLLWKIFAANKDKENERFERFVEDNKYWLDDYALFKVIKFREGERDWQQWNYEFINKDRNALDGIKNSNRDAIQFHKWLQWQLFEQFRAIKKYAENKDILLMGDLPILVSRDSADVWYHQDYYKLHLSSGAPPDLYYAKGQRWGMPPYNWEKIAEDNYIYLIERLRYAENFYDSFRIDHSIGLFRLWTISNSEPLENAGLNGSYDPQDEGSWEAQGRRLLTIMLENTSMLPCAEDLGTVPESSFRVLKEFGIPGMDVQRWMKDWGKTYNFIPPNEYRKNSLTTISTHDTTPLSAWWKFEAGTIDERLFIRKCRDEGISFDEVKERLFDLNRSRYGRLFWRKDVDEVNKLLSILKIPEDRAWTFIDLYNGSYDERIKFWNYLGLNDNAEDRSSQRFTQAVFKKICSTSSVFCTNLLQDWLSLDDSFEFESWDYRINFPGTVGERNWTIVMPMSLEDLLKAPVNKLIKQIIGKS